MITNKFVKMLVDNTPGVLDRVAGIIRRHGWNVESLSVGEAAPALARMNFAIRGQSADAGVLGRHLSDLDFVHGWEECSEESHLFWESAVVRVRRADFADGLLAGARLIEDGGETLFLEFSGTPRQVDEFFGRFGGAVIDSDRSGAMPLSRREINE